MTSLDNKYFKRIFEKKLYEENSIKYILDSNYGEGYINNYKVMPGLELMYADMQLNEPLSSMMELEKDCIEITYCLSGQVEIKLENEKYAFMTNGDISLFGYQVQAFCCDLTSKVFKGIRIMIFLDEFIPALNKILNTDEFKKDTFLKDVFKADRCIISHGNQSLNHIYKELYLLPDEYKIHLMKIKVVELILYLISGKDYKENETVYFSRESIEKIKYARKIIIENSDKFITLKKLSEICGMNTTDLEKGFKSLYGSTVFAYSKMCKMSKAKELLRNGDYSVLQVSLAVGYSNGGKFAKAFKDTFGMLPTKYRKENGKTDQ
ncbi:MAG TPA: hypothetical protein DG753_00825 [Clostridium sp.]|nr:hypothetical protein [Clostridium sp.]